jgi:hypothetical protein
MSRQNYYARRRHRQRRQVDGELVASLVQRERLLQPRLGTRKLHHLLRSELQQAGVRMGRDRLFEELRQRDLLLAPVPAPYPHTTQSRHSLLLSALSQSPTSQSSRFADSDQLKPGLDPIRYCEFPLDEGNGCRCGRQKVLSHSQRAPPLKLRKQHTQRHKQRQYFNSAQFKLKALSEVLRKYVFFERF